MRQKPDRDSAQETIEEKSPKYFGTAKELVDKYTHCPICASRLHFTYFTDFGQSLATEHTKCPECGFKGQCVSHKLQ